MRNSKRYRLYMQGLFVGISIYANSLEVKDGMIYFHDEQEWLVAALSIAQVEKVLDTTDWRNEVLVYSPEIQIVEVQN